MITDYHAKLYAHELLRHLPSDSVEKLTMALMEQKNMKLRFLLLPGAWNKEFIDE